jgi:hypothetical protein
MAATVFDGQVTLYSDSVSPATLRPTALAQRVPADVVTGVVPRCLKLRRHANTLGTLGLRSLSEDRHCATRNVSVFLLSAQSQLPGLGVVMPWKRPLSGTLHMPSHSVSLPSSFTAGFDKLAR